jgi:predicted XRE-type DNA-binding protein
VTKKGSEQVDQVKLILIEGIAAKIRKSFDSQREAAQKLEYHEGVVSRLCNGNYERFSVEFLVNLAHRLGAAISVQVS